MAKWLYWSRGVRAHTLAGGLFGEPAWDLLLDLYIREKSGSRSSVTSACIGSRSPHTTALRHISALCRAKWIDRIPDDADKRRFWLALTPGAMAKLDRHFDKLVTTAGFVSMDMQLLE
ncbi:MAG: MarR family winged helix-turn-helix transcriptional regulator [Novosphingobium sp.]